MAYEFGEVEFHDFLTLGIMKPKFDSIITVLLELWLSKIMINSIFMAN